MGQAKFSYQFQGQIMSSAILKNEPKYWKKYMIAIFNM